ncbi:MAG: cupin domain-containing protein [Anaerolineales bacterium]|nr:cupin domain-containing protein [Anaerolineales bacterium]
MGFLSLNNVVEKEIVPGYRARFIHSENMTLAFWEVDAGAALPEHSHPHEQIANVLEGHFELTVDGDRRILEPGTVAIIPSHVPHSGKAITDCRLLDAFHPCRDDYR